MRRLKLGLMSRIALALGAVGLIPLLAASLPMFQINREALEDQVLKTHSVAARTAADRVGASLAALGALAEAVASNPVLLDDPLAPAAQELLRGTLQARADVVALALVNERGEEVVRAQRVGVGAEVEPLLGGPRIAGVEARPGAATTWLLLDSDLPGGVGRLRLVADGRELLSTLEAVEIGDEADLVLATTAGRVVAGTLPDLAAFPEALVAAASSRRLAGAGAYPGGEGEPILGAYAPVAGSEWFVASRQPARVARAIELRMVRDALLAFGVALLLVAALSTGAYTSLVRPIRRIARAQRRLVKRPAAGDGGDEIEELRASFELIERRVLDQEELGRVFLGRYQVVELLGEGAMGSVFRGWDPKLERPVALKTVRLSEDVLDSRRRELASQLRREAVTAARFSHPHIVAIYDVEDTPEVAFIAMEFVAGIGLDRLLWRGSMEEGSVLTLGLAVARALDALHNRGVVHRDVKPSNVLLGFEGEIKVTDFGIAEYVSSVADDSESFFGTPGYVPPETIRGEGYDALGDLFALGVTLYECLTGRQPFASRTLRDTVARTLSAEPEAIQQTRPGVAGELAALVGELLAKERARRPPSAGHVVDSLEQLAIKIPPRWDPSGFFQLGQEEPTVERTHALLMPTVPPGKTQKLERS